METHVGVTGLRLAGRQNWLKNSAETNGCLPHKGKQQEKHRDQGKDVDQR